MIAGCPACAARYRIDTAKLRPEGARLRCARCETVFRVRPPDAAAGAGATPSRAPAGPAAAPAPRAAQPAARVTRTSSPATPAPAATGDPEKLVLIAHPEPDAGKQLADAVAGWGLRALLVHDGVEAILHIQRALPRIVVLDAALPKMYGFQVCELMKRNEQLREIPVVLIGAIHDRGRYRRAPEELYGADAYAERHELPGALTPLLERFGIATGGGGAPAAAPVRPAAPAPVRPAAPPPARAAAPPAQGDPEVEKGLRLARIIVSDVILYNPEKFEAGVRGANVVQALANELDEGLGLFAQRVDTNVCDPREYLERELVRVARSRGMKG